MNDLVYVPLTLAAFAILALLVGLLDRLVEGDGLRATTPVDGSPASPANPGQGDAA